MLPARRFGVTAAGPGARAETRIATRTGSVTRLERAVLGDRLPDGVVLHHQLTAIFGFHDLAVSHLHPVAGGIGGKRFI